MVRKAGLWMTTGLVAGAMACLAATTPTRKDVAADVEKTTKEFGAYRHKVDMSPDGKVKADPVQAAKFQADFSRAVALYEQQPDDAAALTGLTYVFMYCDEPPSADRDRCRKTLPRAQQTVLDHWIQKPDDVRSIIFYARDLDFMDVLYEKSDSLKMFIAEMAGGQWVAKFHNPKTPAAERQRAYDMAIKYGNAMMADTSTITMKGTTMSMVKWKGNGLVTSVQKMGVGKVMPDFGFTTLDRKPASLASQRGKVVLVDFWATWCVPCVAAMPDTKKFREELQAKGQPFDVISIDAGDSIEKVVDFQQKKVSMPWINWHQETFTEEYFRIGIHTLPTYFVLDKNGVIVARGGHFDEGLRKKVREALAAG